jgi:hypothetical protein
MIRSLLAVYINLCVTAFVGLFVKGETTIANMGMAAFLVMTCICSLLFAVLSKPACLEKETVQARISTLY